MRGGEAAVSKAKPPKAKAAIPTAVLTGKVLYRLYAQASIEGDNCLVDDWEDIDDRATWEELADRLTERGVWSDLQARLESAECVIAQVSDDTYGARLSVKEFADRSGYDS